MYLLFWFQRFFMKLKSVRRLKYVCQMISQWIAEKDSTRITLQKHLTYDHYGKNYSGISVCSGVFKRKKY